MIPQKMVKKVVNDIKKYTIKQVEEFFAQGQVTEEFLSACANDTRKAVGTLLRRYQREQADRKPVWTKRDVGRWPGRCPWRQ